MASRLDAQNRLTVTADALTGRPGAQRRDARDVQALLGLRHRAADDDVVHIVGRIDARRARERFANDHRGQFVGPREAQSAGRRLADGGANGGDDDRRRGIRFPRIDLVTSSCTTRLLEIAEQIFQRFADFLRLALEQVRGAVDDDEFLRFLELARRTPTGP